MSIRETEFPQFVTAFRGYDRLQVDDYISRLREYATQFEERALLAEPELAAARLELVELREQLDDVDRDLVDARRKLREAPTTELPPRLGQILTLASEEAESITEQARRDAQEILHRSRTAADETMQRARRDSELLLAEAGRRRDAIENQIAQLDAARRALVEHLTAVADGIRETVTVHTPELVAESPEGPREAAPRPPANDRMLSLPSPMEAANGQ